MYQNILALSDPDVWGEDAMEFRPERFLNLDQSQLRYTYIPFGIGNRQCIGTQSITKSLTCQRKTICRIRSN